MSEIDIKKTLTQNSQKLEEKVLKAIFKRNNSILDVVEIINEKVFTISEYSYIYTAMVELYKKDEVINADTVQLWLEKNSMNVDSKVINKLYNESYTALKIKNTATMLKELYQRRYMLQNLREIIENEEQAPTSSEDILNKINDIAIKSNEVVSCENVDTKCLSDSDKIMAEINKKLSGKFEDTSIKVGIPVIDNEIGGFKEGKVWTIIADSQVGKSMLAMQLAIQASILNPEIYVDYYSLEMTKEEQEYRALAMITGIEPDSIENPQKYFNRFDEKTGIFKNYYETDRNSELVKKYFAKIREGSDILNSMNLYIDDTPDLDVKGIEARIKKNNLKRGRTDIVIIDHMNIPCSGTPSEVVGKLDEGFNTMKKIAKKLKCTVICLQQFSNELKNDPLKKPDVFAIRGSGAARHYSDVIVGIWRPEVYRDVMEANPELKGHCDLTWCKTRGCKKPEPTLMDFNGYMFVEKEHDTTRGDIANGKVTINSNGEIIEYDED